MHPRCDPQHVTSGRRGCKLRTLFSGPGTGNQPIGKRARSLLLREILRHHKTIFKHEKEHADQQFSISTGDRARENMPISEYKSVQ